MEMKNVVQARYTVDDLGYLLLLLTGWICFISNLFIRAAEVND